MQTIREIMTEIASSIDADKGYNVSQLKALWNSLSELNEPADRAEKAEAKLREVCASQDAKAMCPPDRNMGCMETGIVDKDTCIDCWLRWAGLTNNKGETDDR